MANEKRLIAENDVYSLFGANGMARLHVADIDALPRVDAVEVVHGRWIEHRPNVYECTACHTWYGNYGGNEEWSYCPNCGAKMDGDGNA